MKTCSLCGIKKDIEDFAKSNTTPIKIHYKRFCKECDNKRRTVSRNLRKNQNHPDKGQKCQICNKVPDAYYLDHDWKTGKFRGWLCNNCNTGLGMFKDDLVLLENAKRYLTNTL